MTCTERPVATLPHWDELCREALTLWLDWSRNHARLTEQLYQERATRGHFTALAQEFDSLEQLHMRAVELSETLLEEAERDSSARSETNGLQPRS